MRLDDVWLPATYKTLWLIYTSLGPAQLDTANQMANQFYKNMNVNNVTFDSNKNGRVDDCEKNGTVYQGVR